MDSHLEARSVSRQNDSSFVTKEKPTNDSEAGGFQVLDAKAPRISKSDQATNPCGFFERAIQWIANRFNVGRTYRQYVVTSNVAELCKDPGTWKENPDNAVKLRYHLEKLKGSAGFAPELRKILSSISPASLGKIISFLDGEIGHHLANKETSGERSEYKEFLGSLCYICLEKMTDGIFKDFFSESCERNSNGFGSMQIASSGDLVYEKFKLNVIKCQYEVGQLLNLFMEEQSDEVKENIISAFRDKFRCAAPDITHAALRFSKEMKKNNKINEGDGNNKVPNNKEAGKGQKLKPEDFIKYGENILVQSITNAAELIEIDQALQLAGANDTKVSSASLGSDLRGHKTGVKAKRVSQKWLSSRIKGIFDNYRESIQEARYDFYEIKASLRILCKELNLLSERVDSKDKETFFNDIQTCGADVAPEEGSLLKEVIDKLTQCDQRRGEAELVLNMSAAEDFLSSIKNTKTVFNEIIYGKVARCFEGNEDARLESVIRIYQNFLDVEETLGAEGRQRWVAMVKERMKKYAPLNDKELHLGIAFQLKAVSQFDCSTYTGKDGSTYGDSDAVKAMYETAEQYSAMRLQKKLTH